MSNNTPILHIDSEGTSVPFEIHTMEWIEQNRRQQNSAPHRHDYFTIIWVQKGSGTHLIDADRYPIEDNTVYCISPGQVHWLKADGNPEGYVISFTTEFFCLTDDNYDILFNAGLFYSFSEASMIKVSGDMQEEMKDMAEKMMKEYGNYFLLRSEVLRGFLKIFLIYLTRQYHRAPSTPQATKSTEMVKRFLLSLEKNFASRKMVADYAEELSITPNHLNETVKKVSGFPASEHIKKRIILEAKRQALYADLSMKEIAYSLGFEDLSHFSKFFRNATGISFSDFKKDAADHLGRTA
jgi:AraC-like DNA-binding protein